VLTPRRRALTDHDARVKIPPLCRVLLRREGHLEAELAQLVEGAGAPVLVEGEQAGLVVLLVVAQHMEGDHQDAVADGDGRLLRAPTGAYGVKLRVSWPVLAEKSIRSARPVSLRWLAPLLPVLATALIRTRFLAVSINECQELRPDEHGSQHSGGQS
jgi:hypothetical protein